MRAPELIGEPDNLSRKWSKLYPELPELHPIAVQLSRFYAIWRRNPKDDFRHLPAINEDKRGSRSEHFGQEGKGFLSCGVVDFAQPLHQSYFVHGADLVQDDLVHFSLEPDGNPGRIVMSFYCHGHDNDGADMTIRLIR